MNSSKLDKLEPIYEKIRQGESLSLAEKLKVIWRNPVALILSLFAGSMVPAMVMCCKRKAEGSLADAHTFLGLNLPEGFWFVASLLIGLISLHSVYDTSALLFQSKKRSSPVIRLIVCVFIELVWLGIDPRKVMGTYSGWFEIGLGFFLLLAIVFSNAIFFGSVIAEGEIETDAKIWARSHAAKCIEYEATIAGLHNELSESQVKIRCLRDWFVDVQRMADHCRAGSSGTSVIDIKRRKVSTGAYRHEIVLREADVNRTRCKDLPPVVLSDPLLECPTQIGRGYPDNNLLSAPNATLANEEPDGAAEEVPLSGHANGATPPVTDQGSPSTALNGAKGK